MHFKKLTFNSFCFVALFLSSLLLSKTSYAAVRTWDGEGTDGTCGGAAGDGNKWSCAANWSSNTIPGASDVATFDATSPKNATIDASFAGSVQGIDINTGYSGIITQSRSLTIGTGNYDQNAGTFTSGSQTMDLNGTFNLTGGTFSATTGTFTADRSFTVNGGAFTHNSGTVTFDGGSASAAVITCGSGTFNVVQISKDISSRAVTVNPGCTVPLSGTNPSSTGTITNSGIINVTGNWTISGGYTSSGGSLTISGTSMTVSNSLTLTTGSFPSGLTTLTVGRTFDNSGSLLPNGLDVTLNGGGAGTDVVTCGTVTFNSFAISKDIDTRSVNISSGCTIPLTSGSTATLTNSGIINVTGSWTHNGSYTSSGGTLSVSGTTVTITKTLVLTSGTVTSGITTLNVGYNLNNSGNLLPNNLALTLNNGIGTIDDHELNCGNATFSSITLNKPLDGHEISLTSNCTTGNFTSTIGGLDNPDAARTLYITGNYSQPNNVVQGGSNLTIEFTGSGTQTISKVLGTFESIFRVNKSGGSVSLITPLRVVSQTCDVVEGTFNLGGNSFICDSTFTVQDGGTLGARGSEVSTTPTLETGSTVRYVGDGDSSADNFLPKDWSYKHLTVNFTDSNDTLDAPTSNSLTTNEVGYWKMDENTGITVEDSSSNNNTATITNAVFTTTSLTPLSVSNVSAMDFDGLGDYLDLGNNLDLAQNVGAFSIFAWIRKDGNSGVDQIFGLSQGDNVATTRVGLYTNNDEVRCVASAGDAESEQIINTTETNLSYGVWYPVVCVINFATDSMAIYVNGVAQTISGTPSFTATTTSSTASQRSAIGVDEDKSGDDFSGEIDEVRVWTKVLSQSEINALSGGFTSMTISSRTITGNFTNSAGTFVSPTTFTVGGNFSNSSTFSHNSGTLILNGSNQQISGDTTFNNFTKSTSTTDTLTFVASSTQTVMGTMTLEGASSNLLSLRSSVEDTQWEIDPQGARTIAYLDVQDSHNINETYINAVGTNSINSGNNINWNFNLPGASSPSSITQATNASGRITFETDISDNDSGNTRAKVEYSDDGGSTWFDPDLISATPSSGSVDLDDSQTYQIGSVNAIDTSTGTITLTIVWDTKSASNENGSLDNVDETDIRLRVTTNDTFQDGPPGISSDFEVDNLTPTSPGSFGENTLSPTSANLTWTVSVENNFSHYEIWYGTTQSDVENRTGTAAEWDNDDDSNLTTLTTTQTTITGLSTAQEYFARMWAVDNFGNESNSATDSFTTTSGNSAPATPTSLDPANLINGSWTNDNTPTFTFTLSDSDMGDTIRYRIQIDNDSDFSSPVVNYLSSAEGQGSRSFTVGQSTGGGTYTIGSLGQTLAGGNYYLRVKAIDASSSESSYASANSGSVAFRVDTEKPSSLELTAPANNSYASNQRPTFKWDGATDLLSGIDKYKFQALNGTNGSFTINDIPYDGTENYVTDKYTASFSGSSNTNLSIFTKSSSSWSSSNNNGKLNEGKVTWKVTAYDNASNNITEERNLLVDLTGPYIQELSFNGSNVLESNSYDTSDRTPTITGKVIDPLSSQANLNKVASGVKEVEIKIEQKNSFGIYSTHTIYTVQVDKNYFTHNEAEITDNSLNTSDKYALFSFTPQQDLPNGEYLVTITAKDNVGNVGSIRTQPAQVTTSTTTTPTPTPASSPTPSVTPTPTPAATGASPTPTPATTPTPSPTPTSGSTIIPNIVDSVSNTVNSGVQIAVNIYWNTVETIGEVMGAIGNIINSGTQNTPAVVTDIIDIALSPVKPILESLQIKLAITSETWFDQEPTRIFNLSVIELGTDYAVIYWETNHHATSKVSYGPDYDYGSDVQSDERVLVHVVRINGLDPDTTYYYEVMSQNKNYVYDARHEFTTNTEGITKEREIPPIIERERTALLNLLNPILDNPITGPIARIFEVSSRFEGISYLPLIFALIAAFIAVFLNYFTLLSRVQFWQILPLALGMFRKKRHPWGIVYDSKTKEPLDPVIVELTDQAGKKLQRVTDIYGRYEFIVEPGIYKMTAIKTNYEFPSNKLSGRISDELYENLYFGQDFSIGKDEKVAFNIPMDQGENVDWNQEEKRKRNFEKNHRTLSKISRILFRLGFVYSIIVYLINPTLNNLYAVGFFLVVAFYNLFKLKNRSWGVIYDSKKHPMDGVAVRLINTAVPLLKIPPVVTKASGRYNFLVEKGTYQIAVHIHQPDNTYKEMFRTAPIEIKHKYGEVHKDVRMK